MSVDYRDRFSMSHHPFDKRYMHQHHIETSATLRLKQRVEWLLSERGLGIITGQSGVGKTAALDFALRELPSHRYRVVYMEDSAAGTGDIFRTLAYSLDLEPAHRRATLWRDLKSHLLKLSDENDQQVVLVIDDAHRLPTGFLNSLGAFMNFAFDSREILTTWLVGDSTMRRLLSLSAHKHLRTRVRIQVHIDPMGRQDLKKYVAGCLKAAGCKRQIISDMAFDAVFHLSHGVARNAAKILGIALRLAHEHDKDIIDDHLIENACKEVLL